MTTEPALIDLWNQKKRVEILCTLLRGSMGVRELQRAVGGSNKIIYESIDKCKKARLIDDYYLTGLEFGEKQQCGTRLIQLTNRGREVAESLVASGYVKGFRLRKVRERWIMAILHFFGRVAGSTRMIKLLFLSKHELGFSKQDLGSFYRFRPWKYGPFSKGIIDDLEELQSDGYIAINSRRLPQGEFNDEQRNLYVYTLTKKGEDIVQEILENIPASNLKRLLALKGFVNMPLRDLLGYVYEKYPYFITKSTIAEQILRKPVLNVAAEE